MAKGLGLILPIGKGQQGYFEVAYDTLQNERYKIINLFKTMEGERFMQPNIGIGIHKYLFNQNSKLLETKLDQEIREKIKFFLPNIVIMELDINISNEDIDRNRINIFIKFRLKSGSKTYETVTLTL